VVSTRARLVELLRTSGRTVNELADELQLTDNAVRSHLDSLVKQGKAQLGAPKPGVRKPHQTYELSPAAKGSFAKAYEPVLSAVLDVLEQRLPKRQRENMLRDSGRRLAQALALPDGTPSQDRIDYALSLLQQLGGLPEWVEDSGECQIVGRGCPLNSVVRNHPDACLIAEALLQELIGVQVKSECEHGEVPHCCFQVKYRKAG
jgi:DeoR family suf operon transcriptional repressor